MTVESTLNKINYEANGIVDTFAYTFLVFEESHMFVYLDGVEYLGNLTITGLDNPAGGTVQLADVPDSGVIVTLYRMVPTTQETDYEPYSDFPANTIERDYDLGTMASQQLNEEVNRSLKASVAADPGVDYTLPLPEADTVIGWNDTADGFINGPTFDEISSAQGYSEASEASSVTSSEFADASEASSVNSSGFADDAAASADEAEAASLGRLLNIELFLPNTIWPKPANCSRVRIRACGGGGGGGSVGTGVFPGRFAGSGSGGGGSESVHDLTVATTELAIVTGSKGIGGGLLGPGPGSNGGDTTVLSNDGNDEVNILCNGGIGGIAGTVSNTAVAIVFGGFAVVGQAVMKLLFKGDQSNQGYTISSLANAVMSPLGGSGGLLKSPNPMTLSAAVSGEGIEAVEYGQGGGGAWGGGFNGGDGKGGMVIIESYA